MLTVNSAWAVTTVLLWIRLSVLWGLSPMASAMRVPVVFWLLWTLVLSGLLAPSVPAPAAVLTESPFAFILAAVSEGLLGAALGLAIHTALAALAMAGRLLDLQMGLGMGAILDPVTRANSPALATGLTLLGLAIFWNAGGAAAWMQGFVFSAQQFHPGQVWALPSPLHLAALMASMFSSALLVMAPAFVALLLLELVVAVISRVLPQMNVLLVAGPAKSMFGLAVIAVAVTGVAPVTQRLLQQSLRFWQEMLA